MTFIVSTNIVASRPPKCQLTGTTHACAKNNLVLYVPRFNSGGPLKFKMSYFQIANFVILDFQTLDPKFHLALEPKVLKLGDSFFHGQIKYCQNLNPTTTQPNIT